MRVRLGHRTQDSARSQGSGSWMSGAKNKPGGFSRGNDCTGRGPQFPAAQRAKTKTRGTAGLRPCSAHQELAWWTPGAEFKLLLCRSLE